VELHIVAVKEVVANVRGLFGLAGIFGIASTVEATEHYMAAESIAKLAVLDGQAEGRHD
jgi:hypothetical protein